jgi:hypothetical protein
MQELEALNRMAPEQMADFPSGQDSVYIPKHIATCQDSPVTHNNETE